MNYDVGSLLELSKNLIFVYSLGIILVGIFLFGQLQEFIVNIIEDITNKKWGVDNE